MTKSFLSVGRQMTSSSRIEPKKHNDRLYYVNQTSPIRRVEQNTPTMILPFQISETDQGYVWTKERTVSAESSAVCGKKSLEKERKKRFMQNQETAQIRQSYAYAHCVAQLCSP